MSSTLADVRVSARFSIVATDGEDWCGRDAELSRFETSWRTMKKSAFAILKGGVMRKAILIVLAVLSGAQTLAQTPLPLPAQAAVMTAAELQTMIKAYPGGNAEIKSIDAGKHVVDLWLEQRKPGLTTATGTGGIAHSEITEIYYIVQGTATLVTGGRLIKPKLNENLPKTEFPGGGRFPTPTYGGDFEGGVSRNVGPGDVIIVPPGTVHQWRSVDPRQMLVYFIARIDPEHKQAAGAVNAALKKE